MKSLFSAVLFFAICSNSAYAFIHENVSLQLPHDTVKKPENKSWSDRKWKKVTGWHFAISYTRNKLNSFSADLGRYKTFRRSGAKCAFGIPPVVTWGVGVDYLYNKNTYGYGVRAFGQVEMIFGINMRLDIVNNFETEYSTKLRPGMGITYGPLDIQFNYTLGIYNRDYLRQKAGITLRLKLNAGIYGKATSPSPNYSW
ncbi:MAG TPA: hypothetical protein VEC12_15065 [Bacteroidia bacterium]|nr:hypothetical protein [Bacteroidia bacterium]